MITIQNAHVKSNTARASALKREMLGRVAMIAVMMRIEIDAEGLYQEFLVNRI